MAVGSLLASTLVPLMKARVRDPRPLGLMRSIGNSSEDGGSIEPTVSELKGVMPIWRARGFGRILSRISTLGASTITNVLFPCS